MEQSTATRCPICEKPVQADSAGFLECSCGWGGPGDPVESARGFSRAVTLLDRRIASSIAWRDLRRIAARKGPTSPRGPFYLLALLALSTLIYLVLGALVVGAIWLLVFYIQNGVWLGAALDTLVLLYLYSAIFGFPSRSRLVVARLSDYPRLEALAQDVGAQVKIRPPRWVILTPDTSFFIRRRMLWGKALTPQSALGIGVAGLALLSEQELRSILGHELAHHRYAHTLSGAYFAGAERALHNVISTARLGVESNTRASRRVFRSSNQLSTLGLLLGAVIITIVTLPLRLLWVILHLIRMRVTRSQEFRADAVAVRIYGTPSFVGAMGGVGAATSTLRGAGAARRQEMARHNNPNFFAELRRHYSELPQDYLGEIRTRALHGFRTMQSTHPITPDRIRAALIEAVAPPPATPSEPAWRVITPRGADGPEGIETELTRRFSR